MHLQGLLGVSVIVTAAWLLSEGRRRVNWRMVGTAFAVQVLFAVALLKLPASRGIFLTLNRVISSLEESTRAGTSFVFGYCTRACGSDADCPGEQVIRGVYLDGTQPLSRCPRHDGNFLEDALRGLERLITGGGG